VKKPSATSPQPPLSTRKRIAFAAILIAVPVMLMAGMEAALRLAHYDGDQDLVTRTVAGGKEFLVINRDVARKYFAGRVSGIPEPADDRFGIVKGKRTKRIFCLGESTMQGFPYEFHATPPSFLRDRLQAMFPQDTFEVINVGLSAIGSFVVEDLMDELSAYEPDLFLVYLGHNEFYGVYGVGSAVGSGGGWLTRLAVSLLRFKTYLALRDGYQWIRRTTGTDATPPRGSLMGQMVGNRTIPYNGPLYCEARQIYGSNLRSIIHSARRRGIPIMFSSLVSNIRDQKPFVPVFDEGTREQERERWRIALSRGDSLRSSGELQDAISAYRNAVRIDSMNASGLYSLGKALLDAGRFVDAKGTLERARDLDALRFRASGDFQELLLDVCASEAVPVARADSAFAEASPHGIVGNNLILEHLHPNVEGYFLMAHAWAEALRREHLLVSPVEWANALSPADSDLMALSTVSDFDRTAGRIKVDLLMRRWPFVEGSGPVAFAPGNAMEALVYRYVKGQIPWSEARYSLAELYASQGEFARARNECMAVARILPFSYQPLLRVADYYRQEGDGPRAEEMYRRSIDVEDNPFSRMKLAMLLLEVRQPGPAAVEIERALTLGSGGAHPMSTEALATARYLLGAAYAQLGRYRDARESLERALAMKSDLAEAGELLARLKHLDAPTTH
jgi:tetratricopeptide (TPR) repeat protein